MQSVLERFSLLGEFVKRGSTVIPNHHINFMCLSNTVTVVMVKGVQAIHNVHWW